MEHIELRSEEVRKIIGQVPPRLVRSGIGIIGIIVALLLVVAATVPYPETVEGNIRITDVRQAEVMATGELPYAFIGQVKVGMRVEVEPEGYDDRTYAFPQGVVTAVSLQPIDHHGQNVFHFTLSLKASPLLQRGMRGKVYVVLAEKTVIERILHKREVK